MIRLTIIISVKNLRLTRRRTRRDRYHKLGLGSLENRRWHRKICQLCKVFNSKSTKYLFKTTPIFSRIYITKNASNIPLFKVKHIFVCLSGSGICICHKPKGVQLLRLCLSDLREHNFRHNFPGSVNRIGNYSENIKLLFHCPIYSNKILTPLNVTDLMDTSILEKNDLETIEEPLYEKSIFIKTSSIYILKAKQKV